MQKILLDSSVWLSSILKDDNCDKSEGLINQFRYGSVTVIIPALVIAEIINVLIKKEFSTSKIIKIIKNLKNQNWVKITRVSPINFTRSLINKTRNLRLKSLDYLIILEAL